MASLMSKRNASKHSNHKRQRQGPSRAALNRPLFPGGITTYGEFLHARKAAADAQFRPQQEAIDQSAADIPAWYNDYLAKLQSLQQQTAQQYQGLQAQAGSLNEPVTPGSSPEAVAAGNNRANIIKALQSSLIQQQGAQSNKLSSYGAIATAEKAKKQADISKQRQDLAKSRGEFYTDYTTKAKQQEFENAITAKEFGLKSKATNADIAAKKAQAKNAETTYQKEFSKQAAKYGFSPHDWALLGPNGRAKRIQEFQKRSGQQPKSLGRIQKEEEVKIAARNGYTLDQWLKLKPQQRSAIVRGKAGKKQDAGNGELSFRTQEQQGKQETQASQVKSIADALKMGKGIEGVNKNGQKRSRADAAKILLNSPKSPEPVVVSAILDAVYDGHLSRETIKRLHVSGLKADSLARALGTVTYGQWAKQQYKKRRAAIRQNTNIYRSNRHPQPQGHY